MSLNNIVKRLQDVMRNDAGINGDAQRIEQIVWILFLKIYDAKEQEWELENDEYPQFCRIFYAGKIGRKNKKDSKAMTGDELLSFVNNELSPAFKKSAYFSRYADEQRIIRAAFEDNNNYEKWGVIASGYQYH
ncbi:SAM-dependent DNA methyltransferase [Mannheimia haemolytica]|nr:SAM-dependent DNA methyltransferase [Mannheimia haemolytica]